MATAASRTALTTSGLGRRPSRSTGPEIDTAPSTPPAPSPTGAAPEATPASRPAAPCAPPRRPPVAHRRRQRAHPGLALGDAVRPAAPPHVEQRAGGEARRRQEWG